MIKIILDSFKNLEGITYKIMKKGIHFCFILCIFSVIVLFCYKHIISSPNIYYIGLALFKLSIYFMIDFIVCGFVVDNIKKQII